MAWHQIGDKLTHWDWVMHICISKLTTIGANQATSHYLNQRCSVVNLNPRNKIQWNDNWHPCFLSRKCMSICCLWNVSHFIANAKICLEKSEPVGNKLPTQSLKYVANAGKSRQPSVSLYPSPVKLLAVCWNDLVHISVYGIVFN